MAPMYAPGWAHPYHHPGVWYADGGDDPDPEPNDPGADPTDDPSGPEDEWTPPTREEWEAHQEKLRTASGEAAARRKFLRANGIDPKTGKKINPDPEPEPEPDEPPAKDDAPRGATKQEVDRAVRKAAAEAELRGLRKTKGLVVGFNEALSEAGWNGTRLGALMKLVDLDDVEIDDDGEITGLAEQIGDIKRDFPELFKRVRSNPSKTEPGSGQNGTPAAKVDTADKKPPAPEPKDWVERLARQAVRGA